MDAPDVDASSDASVRDAGPIVLDDAGARSCAAPPGPYGTQEGRIVQPFTLDRCDGTPFELYGDVEGYCDSGFTVIVMAAGWCGPCRTQAAQLRTELAEPYAARGVRVVQVLMQDDDYEAPDAAFCAAWVAEHGLTNPVLIDPAQTTGIYFPAGALPAVLIIDGDGVLRHREYGLSTDLDTIRGELDVLLAGS